MTRVSGQWRTGVSLALALAASAPLAAPAFAQPAVTLSRQGALGVQLAQGEGGVRVVSVMPGLTAAAAGLQAGDVLISINGTEIPTPRDAVAYVRTLREGQRVDLTYKRGESRASSQLTMVGRPRETYTGASASYGAVPFQGGLLRDILVTPAQPPANGPVVFILQGYFCASMEGGEGGLPYRAMAQALADRGIATYRVEKPGMGDSTGTPACLATDFDTEMAAFRAGLQTLIETRGIDPSRIVLLGHSMGGVEAPLLAADIEGLRGVAVMGTVVRSWHDYMQELMRVQAFFSSGADPAETEALSEAMRPLLDRIFNEDTPLTTIAAENPEHAMLLSEALNWDGQEQILYRDVSYWRQIAEQSLAAAWRDGDAPVLALYGESDFAAVDDRDHRLIVDIVNHYRPGTAQFTLLPRTGHGFGLDGTRAEAQAANIAAGGQAPPAPFNPDAARLLADWIEALPAR